MRSPVLIVIFTLFLLLVPYRMAICEGQITYTIQVQNDGSAIWIVDQVVDSNASLDTMQNFQNRVTSLAATASNATGRDMAVEGESLEFSPSGSYIAVEHRFTWTNFGKVEDTRITIGDVFQVQEFFVQLYGDGEVYMTYPSQYAVETVSPAPSERNDSLQSLQWLGTNDFGGSTLIVLKERSAAGGFMNTLAQNAALIVGLAAFAIVSAVGFYMFRHNRKKVRAPETALPKNFLGIENAEEKTLKLVKSSGGSLYQSAITSQLGFSKAKTSQLLGVLEHKGMIRRYKKGRDKIVVLLEENSGEN
jgi:uncharacterized membrane protein